MKPVLPILALMAVSGAAHAQRVPQLLPPVRPPAPRAARPAAEPVTPPVAEPRATQPGAAQPGAAQQQTPPLVPITKENVSGLGAFTASPTVRAISLGVTTEELAAATGARAALLAWVRQGGVVFLHTDAAELFGYETVEARQSTARQAGQFFGRTRAAIPFGAHPLLWGVAGLVDEDGQPTDGQNGVLAGASAVRNVYYQAQSGDCFVTGHPRGVPLLQIVEPTGRGQDPEYAAAIAPYGRGWAIVTPNFVEPTRGDGALFATNLLRFAGVPLTPPQANGAPAAAPRPAPLDPYVALPSAWLEATATEARSADFDGAAAAQDLLAAMPPAPAAGAPRAAAPATDDADKTAPLTIRASERNALWRALTGNALQARTRVLVLRARLALQSDDLKEASTWHALAQNLAPTATATQVWGGVISAGEAADRTLASQARAALLQEAVDQWDAALRGAPRPATSPAAGADSTLAGVTGEMVALWAREASGSARITAAEPPLVTMAGNVVVRFYLGDTSLRLALPSAERLGAISAALGVAVDDEELLLFQTPAELVAYRTARGGQANNDALYGDVSGSKILMVSRPSTIVFLPPLKPNGARRPVQVGTSLPIIIGRLHGQVMINSLTGGGTQIPVWLRAGIEQVTVQEVVGDDTGTIRTGNQLRDLAAVGRLLTPAQFEEIAVTGGQSDAQTALAEAQAQAIVQYFANQLGTGTLVELLQRLGAGQEVSEALGDTAELDELGLFRAWSRAAFGA